MKRVLMFLILLTMLVMLGACVPVPPRSAQPTAEGPNMPNPASVNCVKQGGTLEIRTGANGEVGYCKFADGSECEEWALMRGECKPGQAAGEANMPNPASVNCVKQGGTLEIRKEANGEVGYCKFADGSECEEWVLMRGECKPGQAAATYTDPFAYCAAVGTVDAPDSRYTGAKVPDSVVAGVRKALGTKADVPIQPFVDGTTWRCADGKVLACFVGANLPCGEKADLNKTPNTGIVDYCKQNPDAEVVPAVAAGRATVYEWRCKAGTPEIVKQVNQADAQGFIAGIWYQIGQ